MYAAGAAQPPAELEIFEQRQRCEPSERLEDLTPDEQRSRWRTRSARRR
jgi:hypothetical protein